MGFSVIDDINSPDAPAVCTARHAVTIDKSGYRCSTADAFLPPSLAAARSNNLKICTNAVVTSLDIRAEVGGGLKAVGVFFQKNSSNTTKIYHARARREVILCAGAFGSPQLLMLRYGILSRQHMLSSHTQDSGLGPKEHLREMGIEVKKDLPGVGNNLVRV
jgi:choline dehydrogenase-like flavoprotein